MGSFIAPIIGAAEANRQANDANTARANALAQYMNINAPSIDSQSLDLNQLSNAGNLSNAQEQALGIGPSAMEGVSTDPRLAQAQMAALQQLSQTGQMGMTPAEKAALLDSQRSANSMAQAKSAQITDNMARRGMGGSGSELAQQLQAAQSGADRASQDSNQVAANAWQNAMNAVSQSGNLAGQISGQQFQQKSDVAKAKDYINQFNTQNAQQVQQRNVAGQNAANSYNVQNRQNIANSNVGIQNQQQQANKALIQQQFNNQMAAASGRAGQYQGIAQGAQAQAGRTADMYAGIGKGVDTGIGAYMNSTSKSQNAPGASSGGDFTQGEEDDWLG